MTIEDLLSQRPRVRAFALALLKDPHDADDAVQETMARAVAHRPQGPGWLTTVVRNVAFSMRRKQGRARAREREAARPEASPSTAHLVERAEWHRRVVAGLLELPEADRDVLLMRYFDDLSPKEIARRLDQPAGTVRSRIKRALDRLRVRFDAAHGNRMAWIVPLAVVLKRRKTLMAVAGVAAVAVLAIVAWTAMHPARAEPVRGGKRMPAAEQPRATDGQSAEDAVAPRAASSVAVAGFVRDWKDKPVSGALVRALVGGSSVATATSAADGAFVLTHDRSAQPQYVATASGYAPGYVSGGGLILRLQPVVPLFGVVVDNRDEPVAGARVRLLLNTGAAVLDEGRTDAQGRIRFGSVGPGYWRLRSDAAGFAPRVERMLASERAFRVRLTRGIAFGGVVRDPAGQPVPDLELTIRSTEGARLPPVSVRTDPDGRFRFAHVDPGAQFQVRAAGRTIANYLRADALPADFVLVVDPGAKRETAAPGPLVSGRVMDEAGNGLAGVQVGDTFTASDGTFLARARSDKLLLVREEFENRWVAARDGAGHVLVAAPSGGELHSGRVLSHDGRPIPGARVRVKSSRDTRWVYTDHDGVWQARLRGRVDRGVRVMARGYPTVGMAGTGDVVLPEAHRVVAEFVDSSGRPVPGVVAELRVRSFRGFRFPHRGGRASDASGRIVWEAVPSGPHRIHLQRLKQKRDVKVPVAGPLRFTVATAGAITGVVQDEHGRPVVASVSVKGAGVTYGRTDHAGRFRIPYVGPGVHTLVARPDGETIVAPLGNVRAGDHVVLRARAGGVIAGRVVDEHGRALGGDLWLQELGRYIKPDETGRFRFGGLEPGRYTLRFRAPGHWADPVPDLEPDGAPLRLVARPTLSIAGHVDGEGYVRISANPGHHGAKVRADGSFKITGLKPGKYTLTIWREGQNSAGPATGLIAAGSTNVVVTPRR